RKPCMKASSSGEGPASNVRKPIRGTFFACCASTATATASNAPANRIDASAVFFLNGRIILGVIYHADGSKEKRYLRARLFNGCLGNVRVWSAMKPQGGIPAGTGGMEARGLH